jgi:hypothetical protein
VKLPGESSSSWNHISFAIFTWASLQAWSELEELTEEERKVLGDLATEVRSQIDELLREARETQDVVLFQRPLAKARRNVALVLLKKRLAKALALVVTFIGGGSNEHPKVRRFLPNLLGGITGAKAGERPRLITDAASRLTAIEGDLPGREDLVTALNDAGTRATDAIAAAQTAYDAWRTERSEELVEKGKLRLSLQRMHNLLGAQFPGQRAFVESFFLKGSKSSEGDDEEEGGATEGGGGEGSE